MVKMHVHPVEVSLKIRLKSFKWTIFNFTIFSLLIVQTSFEGCVRTKSVLTMEILGGHACTYRTLTNKVEIDVS